MATQAQVRPILATPEQAACKSCSSQEITVFYRTDAVPVNSCILFDEQEEARRYPTGEILLGFCHQCGFIGNLRFDPEMARYNEAYEEQQSFSPRFNEFADGLARQLVERHGIRNKKVLEIGGGKGDFLMQLCELGNNRGVGIDPTYIPGRHQGPVAERVRFIRDFYREEHAEHTGDLVCCRHALEHIPDTFEFVATLRRAIGKRQDTVVFFEVPDVGRVLREAAFWDIYYEHCSYFTLGSLARLFRRCGFEVTDLAKAFDDQYLLLEARPAEGSPGAPLSAEDDVASLADDVAHFQRTNDANVRRWKEKIQSVKSAGRKAVIWGSSSKCVSFLTNLGIRDEIEYVVDINPYRQGKFLPGSGKPIVAPAVLKEYRPDVVIAMNPIYLDEIRQDLRAMGLDPELTAV